MTVFSLTPPYSSLKTISKWSLSLSSSYSSPCKAYSVFIVVYLAKIRLT